jgi:hypothetical protein
VTDFDSILNEPDEPETPVVEATEPPAEPTPEPQTEVVAEAPVAEAQPEAAAPITREDGATWSEKASRWYKDGKIVAGEAPAAPVTPAPEAVTPTPVVEAPKVETPAPVAEPFAFRVNGKRYEIPGLVVPPEQSERVRQLLINGANHEQNFPRLQSESKQKLAQAEQRVEAVKGKYNAASVFLFDRLSQVLAEQPQELEMVKRELALMLKEADLTIPKSAPAADAEPEGVSEEAARAELATGLRELHEDLPGAKILSAEDRAEMEQAIQADIESYFVQREDGIYLDTYKLKARYERDLKIYTRAHQAKETAARDAKKVQDAARFNAGANAGHAAPPAPSKPKPALAAAPSGQKPDWDQRVNQIWREDDDE